MKHIDETNENEDEWTDSTSGTLPDEDDPNWLNKYWGENTATDHINTDQEGYVYDDGDVVSVCDHHEIDWMLFIFTYQNLRLNK